MCTHVSVAGRGQNLLLVVVLAGAGLANVELVVLDVLQNLHDESLALGLEGVLLLIRSAGLLHVLLDGLDETLDVVLVAGLVEGHLLELERVNDVVDLLDIILGGLLSLLGGSVGTSV